MKQDISSGIEQCVLELYQINSPVELTRPDPQFGDFASNIALKIAKQAGKNPAEVAEQLATALKDKLGAMVANVSVAGPGFLNVTLSDQALRQLMDRVPDKNLDGKTIVVEYSDPNPFKVLHAGHLYTSVVGDAIANLLEFAGGNVHRVNFGGDVGLHVAKTLWAILFYETNGTIADTETALERTMARAEKPLRERAAWLADNYVKGTAAYESDEPASVKTDVAELNKQVYQLVDSNDKDSPLAKIYWTCRAWSYEYFEEFYARIGTKFEKYYPESETAPIGLKTVKEQVAKGVYEESDGAVIFNGDKYGLHTRVFINSQGLPTYEAKDVGLIMAKWRDYHFDTSVVITGNDIVEYMKVVLKSIEQFEPELAARSLHLTHGNVKLAGGEKMSSRKGNILRATEVLDAAAEANKSANNREDDQVVLGAVKYSFLKQRIGADIIYDPKESVSLEGNSGPYLQYAHARARSILRKSGDAPVGDSTSDASLEPDERLLMRKIAEYSDVIELAQTECMPHHVATYLYELAQTFNRFYEHNQVIGNARSVVRLALIQRYADTLQAGLGLLGISAPEKM